MYNSFHLGKISNVAPSLGVMSQKLASEGHKEESMMMDEDKRQCASI